MHGRNKYIPKIVIEEIADIKEEHKIIKDHKAMEKMVEYTRVGRELERLATFNWFGRKPTKNKRRTR